MKAKRFRKLAYALMSRIMKETPGCGRCLKEASHVTPDWTKYGSYQEVWDIMEPVRKMYGMGDINR